MSKDLNAKDAKFIAKGAEKKNTLRPLRKPLRPLRLIAPFAICLLLTTQLYAPALGSQTVARGVVRLRVRPKINGAEKGLSRKRFFLIKGSLQDHQSLLDTLNKPLVPSRDCYYKSINATKELRAWLKSGDCDSIYCREIEQKYVEGAEAVPEFREAYQKGLKEFGSRELARKWLANNLTEEIRIGYYRLKQQIISSFIRRAEETSHAKVMSVMTDRKGTAYFTEVEAATYLITNIIPSETGGMPLLWICEYTMKPERVAEEQIVKLSNQEDKKLKCRVVEQPPDACEQTAK